MHSDNLKYTIFKPNKDPKKAVIRKTGHVIEFSLDEVEANDKINEKNLKELTAMRDLQAAKCKNIEDNHPFVLEMSEQDRFTVHMYQEAKAMELGYGKKVKEIENQRESDAKEVAEIKKQLPELE